MPDRDFREIQVFSRHFSERLRRLQGSETRQETHGLFSLEGDRKSARPNSHFAYAMRHQLPRLCCLMVAPCSSGFRAVRHTADCQSGCWLDHRQCGQFARWVAANGEWPTRPYERSNLPRKSLRKRGLIQIVCLLSVCLRSWHSIRCNTIATLLGQLSRSVQHLVLAKTVSQFQAHSAAVDGGYQCLVKA